MAEKQFDIEALLSNPKAKVILSAQAFGRPLVAYIQNELSFNAGNDYNNPFESSAAARLSEVANKALPLLSAFKEKIGVGGEEPVAQFSLKSFEQTVLSWTRSIKPVFNMNLTFIAIRPTGDNSDVTDPVKRLMATVFPDRGEIAGGLNVIKAPMGYGAKVVVDAVAGQKKLSLNVSGTTMLQVGEYFRAPGLVARSASPQFSKEVISTGKPLWASVNVSFEPYRAITYKEFKGYFIS
jgi:hypothetical protein